MGKRYGRWQPWILRDVSLRFRPGTLIRFEGKIGVAVGKVIGQYKMAKHFEVTITGTSPTIRRRQDQIDAEAALDGFYVLRTPLAAAGLDASGVVAAHKNLKHVERDFRRIKSDDLSLRPNLRGFMIRAVRALPDLDHVACPPGGLRRPPLPRP